MGACADVDAAGAAEVLGEREPTALIGERWVTKRPYLSESCLSADG